MLRTTPARWAAVVVATLVVALAVLAAVGRGPLRSQETPPVGFVAAGSAGTGLDEVGAVRLPIGVVRQKGANRVITTSFDLVRPTEFLNAGERGIYADVNRKAVNIQVTDAALNRVAGRYELIGDHCHDVASKLASAPEIGPWLRGVSGGGASGHYSSFSSLVEVVVALLKNNGTEMRDVAVKCVEVLNDFKGTDDGIRAELDQLASEVEQQTKEDKGVS
ncbi:hypothetical protein KG112_12190 [Nocardioides sp. zg-ZUI104]|uniref:hypothetical protein n=1 Tax=Nocardioides faecalis TaxID=2803858 RepID=UPI001BCE0286|nr:hypothetical protein [Nocardioides faecalis]MBS4753565.1 hypothetical protein [Nocardioides faecalis]